MLRGRQGLRADGDGGGEVRHGGRRRGVPGGGLRGRIGRYYISALFVGVKSLKEEVIALLCRAIQAAKARASMANQLR